MRYAKSMALYGTDIEKYDVGPSFWGGLFGGGNGGADETVSRKGTTHWITTKSKYFCSLIIPTNATGEGYEFSGEYTPDEMLLGSKSYTTKLFLVNQYGLDEKDPLTIDTILEAQKDWLIDDTVYIDSRIPEDGVYRDNYMRVISMGLSLNNNL